jgi:hypothetical protein
MIIVVIVILFAILIATNLTAIILGVEALAQATADMIVLVVRAAPDVLTLVIALVVTIAFFPYIYDIYPVPHRTEYYVGILRSPWLPAEKISLRSGRNYYGYTLSADQDWFTVLLARTRQIVYIHTDDILRRSVCEPLSQRKIPVEPPLITTFYRKPATIRACADRKYLLGTGGNTTGTRSHAPAPTVPHGPTLPGTRPSG